LRAAKLLSMSSSFKQVDDRGLQLQLLRIGGGEFLQLRNDIDDAIGCGGGALRRRGGSRVATRGVDALGAGAGSAAAFLRPNFSRILPKSSSCSPCETQLWINKIK